MAPRMKLHGRLKVVLHRLFAFRVSVTPCQISEYLLGKDLVDLTMLR